MKEYILTRDGAHHTSRVEVRDSHRRTPYALALHNAPGSPYPHSPDGHSWGYGGSGPTQLALDILWDFFDRVPHPAFYQAFKRHFLESRSQEISSITEDEITSWAATYEGEKWLIPLSERV